MSSSVEESHGEVVEDMTSGWWVGHGECLVLTWEAGGLRKERPSLGNGQGNNRLVCERHNLQEQTGDGQSLTALKQMNKR